MTVLLWVWLAGGAQDFRELDTRVLSADVAGAAMLEQDVQRRLRAANEASTRSWTAIRDRESWERARDAWIGALRRSLGRFPDPPRDLDVRVARTLQGADHRIDVLSFASRDGLRVTANLYEPSTDCKDAPGILICHSHHAPKSQAELQEMGVLWARAGCKVLVMDQLGHGERRQHPFVDASSYPRAFRVGRQDYYFRYNAAIQLDLVGESLIGWMVWDLMRGVDLLLSRGADPSRIVLLGAVAGGGDPAAVCAALDGRIAAAVPFNFGGPQPENRYPLPADAADTFGYAGGGSWESTRNLRRSASDGFLPWVIVGAIAPRGLVYAHEFAWDRPNDPVWKRLQQIYVYEAAPDRLAFTHGAGSVRGSGKTDTHCTNIGAVHRAMIHPALERWLKIPSPREADLPRRDAAELACGEKLRPLHEAASALGAARVAEFRAKSAADRRGLLREAWGARLGDVTPRGPAEIVGARRDEIAERVILRTEPGILVPLLLLSPSRGTRHPVVVAFGQSGKAGFLKERPDVVAKFLEGGASVCLVDLRGTGETRPGGGRGRTGGITGISSTEQMLGGTLVGARVRDLRSVLKYLRTRPGVDPARIALWGDSTAPVNPPEANPAVPLDVEEQPALAEPMGALVALLGALYEEEIRAVHMSGGLVDFASVLRSPFLAIPHDAVVPGALEAGDLPAIVEALGRPVRQEQRVDGLNRRVPDGPEASGLLWLLEALR
jgi:dienelactone hydrolase